MNKKVDQDKIEKEGFFHKWGVVMVLSLALAIILIDATLLNVSLGTIIKDLNTDIQKIQWVITAYSLVLASFTITGGRLGDLFGRKKMFITGAIVFAIGSFIASISPNVPTLIIGESIIEGFGAAMMMPATASLLISKYQGRDRGIAFGIWGGVAAASSAIGPLLGGYLTSHYSWRWGFRINVFVAAVLVLGSVIIKECRDDKVRPDLDLVAVGLSSVGLLGIVFGIIESTTYGWVKAKDTFVAFGHALKFGDFSISFVTIILGMIFLALFYAWERRTERKGETPLVSLGLFKSRQFSAGMVTTAVMSLGQSGLFFSIPVFLQSVRGLDAFHTGVAFLPMSLTALIIAPLGGFLGHKLPQKGLIQLGLFLNVSSYFVLRNALTVDATAYNLIPGLILMGMGFGLIMAQLNNVTLSAVSSEKAGEASGVNNTMRQLGATLGTAVIGAVLISAISNNLSDGIKSSKVIPNNLKSMVTERVEQQTSNIEFGGGANIQGFIPAPIKTEIVKISQQSVVDANKKALLYSIFIGIIGFIASFFLPRKIRE